MNTNGVSLIQHLQFMKMSIEEISDKNERMCAVAGVLAAKIAEAGEKNLIAFRLAEVLEEMLSEVVSQCEISRRLDELIAVYDPPEKKSAA